MRRAYTAHTRQTGAEMTENRIQSLEEQVAHLQMTSDSLSDTVARQAAEIARLTRQVELLMQREAEREVDASGTVPLADPPPPHW